MKRPGPIARTTELRSNPETTRAWQDRSRRTSTLSGSKPSDSTLGRGPGPKRTKGLRPKKRTAAEKERIYGSPERIAWSKAQPCKVPICGVTPTEIAHTESGGMGRKADAAKTTHLCHAHHAEQHAIGIPAFEAKYGISLATCASETDGRWQTYSNR